MSISSIYSC